MTDDAHRRTPAEIQAQIAAERDGLPFLTYRRGDGAQELRPLDATAGALVVGREPTCDVPVDWDHEVSRAHAILEPVGTEWVIADDGLSSNGTFVNGERVSGRRRLRDGDRIRLGSTTGLVFRAPEPSASPLTIKAPATAGAKITEAQRRVLVALCRPYRDGAAFASPATNAQIAAELFLSVDAIKTHMKALYERFAVGDLAQQQKRARLVELAFLTGEITQRDLDG